MMDGRLGSFPSHVITTAATLPDSPYANEIQNNKSKQLQIHVAQALRSTFPLVMVRVDLHTS